MKARLTFWMRLLCYALVVLAVSGGLRLAAAMRLQVWLIQFESAVSPLYLGVTGGLTCLGALVAAAGLWLLKPWARNFAWGFVGAYAAWYWIDRLLLTQSKAASANWIFALLVTVYCLLYVFFVIKDAYRVS